MNWRRFPGTSSRIEPLLQPVRAFFSTESAGGILLLLSVAVALVWSNSPWNNSYHDLWHTSLAFTFSRFQISMSLQHWVNDGLMVLFFLLVGLEIKRELLAGELASFRRASLPIAGAIGGMVIPALCYASLNAHGPGAAGWGIPMATDIAFAVSVLALVGRGLPTSVRILLLAIAIVDDLGAVLVIAIFYTHGISVTALLVALLFFAALIVLNLLRVHRPTPYLLLGVGLWAATLFSGVHATIAGVLLAFTIPATRQIEEYPYAQFMRRLLDRFEQDAAIVPDKITHNQSDALDEMEHACHAVQPPLGRVEHALLRPVNFFVVPIFALANAGLNLRLSGSAAGESDSVQVVLHSSVTWGVVLGLLLGKPLGVAAASWLAIKSRLATLPEGGTWAQLWAISLLCGIGFTMSLFVANLAFGAGQSSELLSAKLGILIASVVAGLGGGVAIKMVAGGAKTVQLDDAP